MDIFACILAWWHVAFSGPQDEDETNMAAEMGHVNIKYLNIKDLVANIFVTDAQQFCDVWPTIFAFYSLYCRHVIVPWADRHPSPFCDYLQALPKKHRSSSPDDARHLDHSHVPVMWRATTLSASRNI